MIINCWIKDCNYSGCTVKDKCLYTMNSREEWRSWQVDVVSGELCLLAALPYWANLITHGKGGWVPCRANCHYEYYIIVVSVCKTDRKYSDPSLTRRWQNSKMETHRTSKMCLGLAYKALLQAKKKLMWEETNSKEESAIEERYPLDATIYLLL